MSRMPRSAAIANSGCRGGNVVRDGKEPRSPWRAKSQVEVAEPVIATTWFEEEIHEAFLKIIDRESRDVVTVIEILSPTNKMPGSPGRREFRGEAAGGDELTESLGGDRPLCAGLGWCRFPASSDPHEYLVHVSTTEPAAPRASSSHPPGPASADHPHPLEARDPDARSIFRLFSTQPTTVQATTWKSTTAPSLTRLSRALTAWADQLLRSKGLRSSSLARTSGREQSAAAHASSPLTTLPRMSVRRKSRPWKR